MLASTKRPVADGLQRAVSLENREPMIGPNSVVQTLKAAEERYGAEFSQALSAAACLPEVTLQGLIPEAWFVRLVNALRSELGPNESEAILQRSGKLTADYVQRVRIPVLIRRVLGVLPPRLALPILLSAFRQHAWTFAGAGTYSTTGKYPYEIRLKNNPCCRLKPDEPPKDYFLGRYYSAAFEGLIQVAAPGFRVREFACQGKGDPECRFEILKPERPGTTEPSR